MSITQPVSAFVALGIQQAMPLHPIIISGLPRSTTFFSGRIFEKKKVLNAKCVCVDFLYNVYLKYFSF